GDRFEDGGIGERDAIELGPLAEDRDARGEIWGADVGDEPGLESLPETFLDRDQLTRKAIASENELSPGLVQRVERVKELLLGLGLAGEELNVVDQQYVRISIGVLEPVERTRPDRRDEVVRERLDGRVADGGAAAEREHVVPDRV